MSRIHALFPRDRGWLAASRGGKRSANPFAIDSQQWVEWIAGFDEYFAQVAAL